MKKPFYDESENVKQAIIMLKEISELANHRSEYGIEIDITEVIKLLENKY